MHSNSNYEEMSSEETYWNIGYESAYQSSDGGNGMNLSKEFETHHHFIRGLTNIEAFVEKALTKSYPAFKMLTMQSGEQRFKSFESLSKNFLAVHGYFNAATPDYDYSANVELFIRCFSSMGLAEKAFTDPLSPVGGDDHPKLQYELFNELIEFIRTEGKKPKYKSQVAMKKYKPIRRVRSTEQYFEKLFDKYGRLLILRIDLGYRKDYAQHVTLEQTKADLKHFLDNKRCNMSLFKNWVGYIWKLEWAQDKLYHWHFIAIYNGNKVQNDIHWAFQLGEYWKNVITKGNGGYFNCNSRKEWYYELGIGKISRTDLVKRGVLMRKVVGYLAKSDQFLLARSLRNCHCFDKGNAPEKSNAGRPRKLLAVNQASLENEILPVSLA